MLPTVQGPAPSVMGFEPFGGTGVSPEQFRSERMMTEPAYASLYNNPDPMILQQDSVPFYEDMGGRRFIPPSSDTGFPPDAPAYDPTDATDAALRRAVPTLMASNAPDFVTMGGGTSTPPPQDFQNIIDKPQQGFQNVIVGDSPGAMGGRPADPFAIFPPDAPGLARQLGKGDRRPPGLDMPEFNARTEDEIGMTPIYNKLRGMSAYDVQDPLGSGGYEAMAKKVSDLASGKTKAETKEDLNILQKFGRWLQGVGKGVSDFGMDDIKAFFTQGGPGGGAQLIPFTQDTSHPYGGGGGGGASGSVGSVGSATPIQCPPGFKFDPVQNVCVPIVAPKPPVATPPVTTTPAPGTTAATGGIANLQTDKYPFTLTPPVGVQIGNLEPVRAAPVVA